MIGLVMQWVPDGRRRGWLTGLAGRVVIGALVVALAWFVVRRQRRNWRAATA